jgi:hypothetical protein
VPPKITDVEGSATAGYGVTLSIAVLLSNWNEKKIGGLCYGGGDGALVICDTHLASEGLEGVVCS